MNRTSQCWLCMAIAGLLASGWAARAVSQELRLARLPVVSEAYPSERYPTTPVATWPDAASPHELPMAQRFAQNSPPVIASPEILPHGEGWDERVLDDRLLDERFNEAILPPPDYSYSFDDPTLGPTIRIFEPKARVYFDTGWEAPDKLDIFHDGSLAPSINFLEIFWANQWPENLGQPDWRWGPNIGVGISSRAGDSSDGTTLASGAPVLLMSYGLVFEFPLTSAQTETLRSDAANNPAVLAHLRRLAPKAGVEVGYALGISADESLDYSADGAIYVGVTLHVLP